MKKLSNIKAELKKSFAYIEKIVYFIQLRPMFQFYTTGKH